MNKPKDSSDVELKRKWTVGAIKSYHQDQVKEEGERERRDSKDDAPKVLFLPGFSNIIS